MAYLLTRLVAGDVRLSILTVFAQIEEVLPFLVTEP